MAIAYKSAGSGSTTEASGGNLAPLCPAVVDANDILILHAYYEGTVTAPTTPSGWILIANNIPVETVGRHYVFAKLAIGTEDGTAISLGTPAVTTMRTARIYSFSGWTFGTIEQNIGTVTTTTHATDPVMPNVTTSQVGHLAVALIFQADDNTMGAPTGVTGGTWTQRVLYEQLATTPDSALALYDCTPTANPGTVSGGTIATANDPTGSIGFSIGYINIAPTTALNSPNDVATGVIVTPTLAFTGTDTESDVVEYEVQVDTDNTFKLTDFGSTPSNTTNSFNSGYTLINKLNPVSFNCILDTFEIIINANIQGCKIGIFYNTTDLTHVCRESFTVNLVAGLNIVNNKLNALAGDLIGAFIPSGNGYSFYIISSPTNDLVYNLGDSTDGASRNYTLSPNTLYLKASASNPLIKALSITDAGFTVGHPFASGVQKEYTIQAPLENSTEYFWRVRAIDPSGSNAWGDWSAVRSFTTEAGNPILIPQQTNHVHTADSVVLTGLGVIALDISYIVDEYAQSNFNTSFGLDGATSNGTAVGQAFTGNGSKLYKAKFYISKTNSPSGNVYAKLYALSGTYGGTAIPIGSALATSIPIDASIIPLTKSWVEFSFSVDYTLVNGTKYFIVIEHLNTNAANHLSIGVDNSTSTHSGNYALFNTSSNPSVWVGFDFGQDLIFQVNSLLLHNHSADNVTLSIVIILVVQEASHNHISDNVVIVPKYSLSVNQTLHNHSVDNVAITPKYTLASNQTVHNHIADNIVITLSYTITVQESLHTHSVDAVVVTSKYTLAVNDAVHSHTTDNVLIVPKYILSTNNAVHPQVSDNVSIAVKYIVTINDALHSHSVDNIIVAPKYNLVLQESSHTHQTDNVILDVAKLLVVADTTHLHTADNTAIVPKYNLVVADANHTHLVDNTVLTVGLITLTVSDSLHPHSTDSIDLQEGNVLVVQEASHSHISDNVIVASKYSLVVLTTVHNHSVDNVVIVPKYSLVTLDTLHTHLVDNAVVVPKYNLVISETLHNHLVDAVILTTKYNLIVAGSLHAHLVDAVIVVPKYSLVIYKALHSHSADNIVLIAELITLTINDSLHSHLVENVVLQSGAVLIVQESNHNHTSDNVILTTKYDVVAQETLHNHSADSITLQISTVLVIQDSAHNHVSDNIVLEVSVVLVVQDANHVHLVENLSLTTKYDVIVADSLHSHLADNLDLQEGNVLTAQSSLHSHSVDNVVVAIKYSLVVPDSLHSHLSENVILVYEYLIVNDSTHNHIADNVVLVPPHYGLYEILELNSIITNTISGKSFFITEITLESKITNIINLKSFIYE